MSWIKRFKASALPNAAPEGVTDPVEERLDARIDELEKRLRDLEHRLPKALTFVQLIARSTELTRS